jgi:hypothetical protein
MYQSINVITYTNEIIGNKMTQDFFTEVHLLHGKLLLVVAMHPLDGSRANHKMGILQAMSSTRVANSRTPTGRAQEPLTIAW